MSSSQRCIDKLTSVGKEEEEEEEEEDCRDGVAVLFKGGVCMDSLAAVGGMGGDIEACIERESYKHILRS